MFEGGTRNSTDSTFDANTYGKILDRSQCKYCSLQLSNVAHSLRLLSGMDFSVGGEAASPHAQSGPRLPQELCDEVIDNLCDDKAALKACSLVCRGWVHGTSKHLFRCLSWPPCCHVWGTFDNGTSAGTCTDAKHVGDFSSFLDRLSRTPRVRGVAEKLSLSSTRPQLTQAGPPYIETLSFDTLLGIIDLIPRLHTLALVDCLLIGGASPPTTQVSRKLKDLYISNPTSVSEDVSSLPQVLHLLRHFSRISELTVEGGIPGDMIPPPSPTSALTQVDALTLLPCSSGFDHWIDGRISHFLITTEGLGTCLDSSVLQTLNLRSHCPPHLIGNFHHPSNLVSLSYYTGRGKFDPPLSHGAPRLRFLSVTIPLMFLTLGIHWPSTGVITEWEFLMVHLNAFDRSPLERVHVVVEDEHGRIIINLPNGPEPENETFTEQLERLLNTLEWERLAAFLERCPSVKDLHLEIRLRRGCPAACELLEGITGVEGRRVDVPRSAMGQQSTIDRLQGVLRFTITELDH